MRLTQVAVGYLQACGLEPGGRPVCWGGPSEELAAPGTFRSLSKSFGLTCGLARSAARAACWFDSGDRLYSFKLRGRFVQIAAGACTACGIRPGGAIACWRDPYGGTALWSEAPSGRFLAVGLGGYDNDAGALKEFGCAIRVNQRLACWGDDSTGVTHPPRGTFETVSVGDRFACAIRTGGTVACWGRGLFFPVVAPKGRFVQISSGGDAACGLQRGGHAVCWGDNAYGQTEVPSAGFTQAAGGSDGDCAIRIGGALSCWGQWWSSYDPLPKGPFTGAGIMGNGTTGCGLRRDHTVACWTFPTPPATSAVPGPSTVFYPKTPPLIQLSVGFAGFCGLELDHSVYCADSIPGAAPKGRFREISIGEGWTGDFGCGLRSGGSLTCWGDAEGENGPDGQTSPAKHGVFTQVSSGLYGACALRENRSMACWGDFDWGEAKPLPGQFSQVAMGGWVCGVRTDRRLECASEDASPPQVFPWRFKQASVGSNPEADDTCGVTSRDGIRCLGIGPLIPAARA